MPAALAEIVAAGGTCAVIEANSHALALHRVADCEFDVAVFTNLSAEHLDFHGTLAQYREDKANLFRLLGTSVDKGLPKFGVVNADDPEAEFFRRRLPDACPHLWDHTRRLTSWDGTGRLCQAECASLWRHHLAKWRCRPT